MTSSQLEVFAINILWFKADKLNELLVVIYSRIVPNRCHMLVSTYN